jgi:serine/threonine protein kinase
METRAEDPLQEVEIWNAIADLFLGLKHIHDLNIAHLDIKPSNIFVSKDGQLLIGDFGLAFDLSKELTEDREGDRNYLAPEILEGHYGKAADIFSLGLVILEMTANVDLPETGEAYHKLRQCDFSDVPFDLETTSTVLIELIQSMLLPEHQRPTIEQLLFHPHVADLVYERIRGDVEDECI